ncbi:MAG TPA: hypothetical protein VFO55_04560 [Gemmatimonadaceae bacterium]|nr:hypothetical protein [Gemmatimonadaceae bacterium]
MAYRETSPPSTMQLQDAQPTAPRVSRELRVRFSQFDLSRSKSGQTTAAVTLDLDGKKHVGHSSGPSSALGDLRISAEACLKALSAFAGPISFELMAVKHIRAFDSNLAIVSITHQQDGQSFPLVGVYLAKDDVCRGAAIAVLNATNRVLGISTLRSED